MYPRLDTKEENPTSALLTVFHAHLRIGHLEQPSLWQPAKAASSVTFLQYHKLWKGTSMKEQLPSSVENIQLEVAGTCHREAQETAWV